MKLFDSLRTRSFRAGGYSFFAALIVLAVLVAVNLIVNALPSSVTKLDATPTKVATISDQTKNVLKSLNKDVTLYWICAEGAEDPAVETLLTRYDSGSAHVTLEKVDPDVNPVFVSEYTMEYYDNSVLVKCGDRTRYVDYQTNIYVKDMETYYATGEDVWNFKGEEAITRAIYYVATDNLPKAYIITGHSEMNIPESMQGIFNDDNVETEELNLISEMAIPEDADLLLWHVPQTDITEMELKVLSDYMAGGGKLLLVTAPIEKKLTNVEKLMAGYGVKAVDGVVMEENGKYYSGMPYYLLPQIGQHTISNPIIEAEQYVLLPNAHGLKVTQTESTTLSVTQLLVTSKDSYSKVNLTDQTSVEKTAEDIDGPFALGVAFEDAATGAKAVWFSTSYIFSEDGANRDLYFNAVNWMCDQKEMIAIRSKNVTMQYLNMNEDSVKTMTWLIVAVVPLSFLGMGIATYVRRKRR